MGFLQIGSVLVLVLCISVPVTWCWSCSWGWIERPDSDTCYRFWDARKMTWDSAQSTCKSYGGNLLQLNSKEEKKWIIAEVSKYPPSYEWWIGLRRNQDNESIWEWIDGSARNESNNYIFWGSGEPNNFRDSEDCGEIWDNLLNDKDCRIPLQSICERPKDTPLYCDVDRGWFDLIVAGEDIACFKILDGVDNFADAETACLNEESTLASIESQAVHEALTAHMSGQGAGKTFWLPYILTTSDVTSWRLPGSDVDVTSQWWADDTPETRTLLADKTLCGVVNTSIDDVKNWSPVSCDSPNTAVCRKPLGQCPPDYIRFLDWCVKVVDSQGMTWWDARGFCNLRNTQLLRIKSNDMQFIVDKAEQLFAYNTSIWLGFAANGSDQWQWFDEVDATKTSFGDFENDKMDGVIQSPSRCGIVRANGTWGTEDCGSTSVGTVCLGGVDIPLNAPGHMRANCSYAILGRQCNGNTVPGPGPKWQHSPQYVCPFGYTVDSVHCYRKVLGGPVDWYTARSICAAEGAFLAEPISEENRQYLRAIMTEDTWTSLNDREAEGRFVWHDNTPLVGDGGWAANEPNNFEIGGKYSENCVVMGYSRESLSSGYWSDVPCSFKAGVVCQKRAGYNIALGKIATQNAFADPYKAIDGVKEGKSDSQHCTVVNMYDNDPAWQLDLGLAYPIGTIVVHRYVSASCYNCTTQMSGFRVFVSNTSDTDDPAFNVYTELADRPQTEIEIGLDEPAIGRYVRIDLPGQSEDFPLTLCEVEVLLYDGTRPTMLTRKNSDCISLSTEWQGTMKHTVSGRECQLWSLDAPHEHKFHSGPIFAGSQTDVEVKNYCRDPDGEGRPWCYTTDPGRRMEFCPIPHCTAGWHLPENKTAVNTPCKVGWTQNEYTGACVAEGQENLTFADAISACRNEEAFIFIPQKTGVLDVNAAPLWTDVQFDVSSQSWKSSSYEGVSMPINTGNLPISKPFCVAMDRSTFDVKPQNCLDRLSYYCSTQERFTKYKTQKTKSYTTVSRPVSRQYFVFEFRGFDGATVLLGNTSTGQQYELRIGGNVLIQSYILDVKTNKKLYKRAINGLYNATVYSGFWISWSDRTLKVGREQDIGRNVFMAVTIDDFLPDTLHIGTMTGFEGEWKVQKENGNFTSTPTASAETQVNLAFGKRTQQSSNYGDSGKASLAVDGCTDGNYHSGCCTHTEVNGLNPWWEVDLGRDYHIKEIVIYNRVDCCLWRLSGFIARISQVSGSTNNADIVFTNSEPNVPGVTHIPTWGRRGRFVEISLPNKTEILTLCEVEVILDSDRFKCEEGWHVSSTSDKCYQVQSLAMAQTQAVEVCGQLEAHLAFPTSPEEEFFLYSLVVSKPDLPRAVWLPIENHAGSVSLLPGVSTLSYKRWKAGTPDVDSSGGRCAAADLKNSTSSGSWAWYPCSESFTVICEKREEITTTTMTTPPTSTTSTTTTPKTLPRDTTCQDGWRYKSDFTSCYKIFVDKTLTFDDAARKCQQEGSRLSNIVNGTEQDFLKELIRSQGIGGTQFDSLWLSGTERNSPSGKFIWKNWDAPWTDSIRWVPGQPDGGHYGNEDCVTILVDSNSPNLGLLNDVPCEMDPTLSYMKGFICKTELGIEITTEPTTVITATKRTTTGKQDIPLVNRYCGPVWEYDAHSNQCYRFSNFPGSFSKAKDYCGQFGGSLTSITSPTEFVFIIGLLQKYGNVPARYWLGLTKGTELGWRWMDDAPLAYFNWAPDEPTDKGCVYVITGPTADFGQWVTEECDQSYHFICKKAGVKDVVASTTSIPNKQDTGLSCPLHGWRAYERSCYLVVQDKTDWLKAMRTCRRFGHGSDLASFKNELEMSFIWSSLDTDSYCNDIYVNSTKCQIWASQGECDYNPVWMATHCHKSCQLCMHNCRDTYGEQCLNWALTRECNTNPIWMATNCADSCGVCKGAPSRGYWLGMQRNQGQRFYSWSDRSPVTFTLWHEGEPRALDYKDGSCVGLYVPTMQMNDGSCNDILDGYVCKQPMKKIENASAVDPSVGCDTNLVYQDMCYKYIQSPMTWSEAKTYCENTENGSLVVIKNRHVQAYVASELHNQIEDIWIGLSINGSLATKLQWEGVDHHIRYTNLEAMDINSLGSSGCFALQQKKPIGLWKEYNCSTKLPFLCQKFRNGFTTTPFLPTMPSTKVASKCEDSWTEFQGVCYKLASLEHGLKTWPTANHICTHYGGNMAYIGSQEVQNFIYSLANNRDIFLGLHDSNNEGVFVWSNGKPVLYTSWLWGEPNNFGVNEDCASMSKYNGQWNDVSCFSSLAFICEIPLEKPVNKDAMPDFSKMEECKSTSDSSLKWFKYKSYCFYMETQSAAFKSWYMAQVFCSSVGGNLASIETGETNDFLTVLVSQSVNMDTWIGFKKHYDNGNFEWWDGSSVQFAAWRPDRQLSNKCATITKKGLWADWSCYDKKPFICKRPLVVSSTTNTTVLPFTSAAPMGGCESGYRHFGAKCYRISDPTGTPLTSDMAFANCRRQRGELLSIASLDEQVFVNSLLIGQHNGIWTSMTRWNDGSFKWGGQRPVHFTNWAPSEPSYTRDGMSHENCVEMIVTPDRLGRWNDVSCDAKRGYICTEALDTSLPPESISPSRCPDGYSGFADKCMRHVTSSRQGFEESKSMCAGFGGRVIIMDSQTYNPYSLLKSLSSEDSVWVSYNLNPHSDGVCFVQTMDTIKVNLKGCTEALTVLCETDKLGSTTAPQSSIKPGTNTCHGENHVRIEGRCFAVFKTQLNFFDMLGACSMISMTSASIHSETQNQQLVDWIFAQNLSLSEIWIGLMDMFGVPFWIDTTNMDYQAATVKNYGSSIYNDNCGFIVAGQYSWSFTSDCTEKRAYLCADITENVKGTYEPDVMRTPEWFGGPSSEDTGDVIKATSYPIHRRYHDDAPKSNVAAPSSLSAGQIGGIIIGVCAFVACVGAVFYLLRCSTLKSKLLMAERTDIGFDNALFQKDGDETVMLQ